MNKSISIKLIFIFINSCIIIFFITSCLGITELDTEKSWCKEKLERRNADSFDLPTMFILSCDPREKEENETQESYDAYKSALLERCERELPNVLLILILQRKQYIDCNKINKYQPTLHEPTT